MDYDLQASLARLAADYRERLSELRRAQETLRDITATARSHDDSVAVEVGPQGQLRAVRLDPDVYDRMTPHRLALTITQLAGEAAADAAGQVRAVMAPFLPGGLPEDGDFTKLLPNAPSLLDPVNRSLYGNAP